MMRAFSLFAGVFALLLCAEQARAGTSDAVVGQGSAGAVEVQPGVWRFRFGVPEATTPVTTRTYPPATNGFSLLPKVATPPVVPVGSNSTRGCLVRLPLAPEEMIYGLGLQLQSFQQRALKKRLRVNADPAMDTGDSHAPVPFYVTTRGYGVFVDTARYATLYLGNKKEKPRAETPGAADNGADGWNSVPAYKQMGSEQNSEVLVEIPEAAGVDVYIMAGPSLREAVQRYNLFSGGGALLPRWGLGFWYRGQTDFNQDDVLKLAKEFRERRIPLDVLGLEPHWQTHAYSASYVWSQLFPNPGAMLSQLLEQHLRVNLWEHAFVHPSSPLYTALLPHSGNYEVWGGLVPDFLQPETRRMFAAFHERTHVAPGVSGYKLDECDNSDFTGNWSFPELSRFPSGADGEQMHSLFGLRYQDAIQAAFQTRQQRTCGLVRSSGALAAPYPYVLYSDLYDHRQFVRGVVQAGFSGLLWTPEVRDSANPEELIRRLESVAFSPLAMVNAWYLRNPPWKQVNRAANNAGQFAADWEAVEAQCRSIIETRMKFIPYLHAAFVRYHREGLPPFRALVMDYPEDVNAQSVDDEYLMGPSVLVAPVIVGSAPRGKNKPETASVSDSGQSSSRSVYLPEGDWYDYWTGKRFQGKQRFSVTVPLERIPLFVKAGTVLPLAQPTLHTEDPQSWKLTALVYGEGGQAATVFEDDGSWTPSLPAVTLEWDARKKVGRVARTGSPGANAYEVTQWTVIP